MTRTELVRRLAEHATRPLSEHARLAATADATPTGATDLFVWFEDTSERRRDGRRGIAGLPESLLPYAPGTRVAARVYAEGHPHLLAAVRIRTRLLCNRCRARRARTARRPCTSRRGAAARHRAGARSAAASSSLAATNRRTRIRSGVTDRPPRLRRARPACAPSPCPPPADPGSSGR